MDTLINVGLTIISRQIHLELDFVYETLRCLSTKGEWTNRKKGKLVMIFIPNFLFLTIFCCISKPWWQWQQMKIWEGNKCRFRYWLKFWYLHLLTVFKQVGMCVELNPWCLCCNAPANITYAKNNNSKVRSSKDGPTLRKRFQNASLNFTWSSTLSCSP
jgi:hypothetical protein